MRLSHSPIPNITLRKSFAFLICYLTVNLISCPLISVAQQPNKVTEQEKPRVLYPFRSDVDGAVGYIDQTGKVIFKPQFDYWDFDTFRNRSYDGLALISKTIHYPQIITARYGFIDDNGKIVITPDLESARDYSDGLAYVRRGTTEGFIDKAGKMLIDTKSYVAVGNFAEGLAAVKSGENYKVGYIDKVGKLVITPQFDEAEQFSEGLAAVKVGHKYGYIDKAGQTVIKPQFDEAREFSEGLAAVKVDGKYGFVGKDGYSRVSYKFEKVESFSDGRALVKVQGFENYFFIDSTGRMAFSCTFDIARSFSGGLAAVRINRQWGYINPQGDFLIRPQFERAEDFYGDLALVGFGGKSRFEPPNSTYPDWQTIYFQYGYINKRGETVFKWLMPLRFGLNLASTEPPRASELGKVKISVNSTPTGAKVYFIPLDIWEDDTGIINDNERLSRRLASKYTSNEFELYAQVYVVILELNGKKVMREVDVNYKEKTVVEIDFSKEK